jgi:hypothetical protein
VLAGNAEYDEFSLQYNVMPPPIGCRVSVQNLIRAEDVRRRFELGQNPVSGNQDAGSAGFRQLRYKTGLGSRGLALGEYPPG